MTIVTHDNKEHIPLLIGAIESPDIGEYITCIENSDNPSRDLFGNVQIYKIHVSEVKGFKGSYSFPKPEILYK